MVGGGWCVVCKPILVFSLGQAEQLYKSGRKEDYFLLKPSTNFPLTEM